MWARSAGTRIGLEGESTITRIVLGYDASSTADRALERTIELATALRAPVDVVSVAPVREFAARRVGTPFQPAEPPEPHAEMAANAATRLVEHDVAARSVVALGQTADSLVELAEDVGADLIVVGASSRDARGVLSGVSDDVARRAHCDVLLVR